MSFPRLRQTHRHSVHDPAIGWVSTSDTLLFGLALFVVLAASLAVKLKESATVQTKLANENSLLAESSTKIQADLGKHTALLEEIRQALDQERIKTTTLVDQIAVQQEEAKKTIGDLRSKGSSLWRQFQKLRKEYQQADGLRDKAEKQSAALQKKLAETKDLEQRHAQVEKEHAVLQVRFNDVLKQSQNENRIRSELIGLKGKLNRVAILFDASESMKEGDRWSSAQKVIASWLEYLSMKECVLIVFSDSVSTYPTDGTFVDLKGDDSGKQRQDLLAYLNRFSPAGRTNTLAALKKAYEYKELDTIVLFTDGSPFVGRTNDRIDTEMVDDIYQLCEQHKQIPINAVGLGNYFSPQLSAFLLKIAELTDGTFVGR